MRVIQAGWITVVFMLCAAYTANLTAFLVAQAGDEGAITSLQECIDEASTQRTSTPSPSRRQNAKGVANMGRFIIAPRACLKDPGTRPRRCIAR